MAICDETNECRLDFDKKIKIWCNKSRGYVIISYMSRSIDVSMKRLNPNRMGFWRYYILTYKRAGSLILKGLVVALSFMVASLFANKMDIANITYFNAMFTVSYFGVMIGFGVGSGFAIHINHNYKDREKVSNYARLGFYFTVFFLLVMVALLVIFKDFIINKFLGVDTGGNSTFYYLSVAFLFMYGINTYLELIIRTLKLFKLYFIITYSFHFTIILGLVLLWVFGGIVLNYVGILYLAMSFVEFAVAITISVRSKKLGINIFNFSKLKIGKSELHTAIVVFSANIVWEFGSIFLALSLLRMDEIIFNVYSYYESVLDVFNNIYFAFVVMTSIDIGRSIGEGKRTEAFRHAQYSLRANVVTWVIYAILSFALFIPIRSGMNAQLQDIALISLALYVAVYLVRFVYWNFSTYILIMGGRVGLQFVLEVASTLYLILLYFIMPFLPNNIYLAYLLITLNMIVLLPFQFIIFYRKKWLEKKDVEGLPHANAD